LLHKQADCPASTISSNQSLEMCWVILWQRSTTVINNEGRLIQCQLLDRGNVLCRLKRQGCPGGNPVYKHRSSYRVDKRLKVFNLPLDGIGGRVSTLTPAPTIIGVDSEIGRKLDCQGAAGARRPIAHGTVNQEECGPTANLTECNCCTVF